MSNIVRVTPKIRVSQTYYGARVYLPGYGSSRDVDKVEAQGKSALEIARLALEREKEVQLRAFNAAVRLVKTQPKRDAIYKQYSRELAELEAAAPKEATP